MTPDERAAYILARIRAAGHSYATLAAEIGITPSAVGQIVRGDTTAATSRYALAKAIGADLSDLWPETERAA